MRWISPAKLKIGGIILAGTLVSGLGGSVLFNGIAHGEWDWPGMNQQVQHLTEVTNNHEGRITNLENQTSTPSGSPTPSPVVVTKVVTVAAPQATASPSATPTQVLSAQATPAPTPQPTTDPQAIKYYYYVDANSGCSGAPYWHVLRNNMTDYKTATQPASGENDTNKAEDICQ